MSKKYLSDVTLIGVDCVDINRLLIAANICEKNFEFAEVKLLTSLPDSTDDRIITINKLSSVEEYSEFVISQLDSYFSTNHVLIIQYDGFILNPSAWKDEFLNYDYIGAPWLTNDISIEMFNFPKHLLGKYVVGNGGFSLRSKKLTSLCSKLSTQHFFKKYHPEDTVICIDHRNYFENMGIKFAPVSLAREFSYESEDDVNYSWNDQFGFHGLSWTDISKWLKMHPEYNNFIQNDITDHLLRLRKEK